MEEEKKSTQVGELKQVVRPPMEPVAKQQDAPKIEWREKTKRHWSEELLKNMAVAAALVLCAVAVKTGNLGSGQLTDAVLTAATGNTVLDDGLGKLTFVSSLFPEATLVFGENTAETLAIPVLSGSVAHAWSEEEPYLSYASANNEVYSATGGEVMGVYHGENEELLVSVRREDGLECYYGNLKTVSVEQGDAVETGAMLGTRLSEHEVTFEVRKDGYSVNPTSWIVEKHP